MTVCSVTAELFHADGQTDRQIWQSLIYLLFEILRTHLITGQFVKPVGSRAIQVFTLSGVIQGLARWIYYNEYLCGVQLVGKVVKMKKSKVFPVEAMKPYSWSRGVDPLIINLCPRCR